MTGSIIEHKGSGHVPRDVAERQDAAYRNMLGMERELRHPGELVGATLHERLAWLLRNLMVRQFADLASIGWRRAAEGDGSFDMHAALDRPIPRCRCGKVAEHETMCVACWEDAQDWARDEARR